MNNYIGFLIRQTRLKQNISQGGLCKGICAPSYLSKIEKGQAEAGEEIIDSLFSALGISYVRDEEFLREAKEKIKQFFALWDTEGDFSAEEAYFEEQKDRLENSELHLSYHMYLLFRAVFKQEKEAAKQECEYLGQFISYMEEWQKARYYLGAAKAAGNAKKAVEFLKEAVRHDKESILYYEMALAFYHLGQYGESMEKADMAYRAAAEEGNPFVLVSASFLSGSCYCNGRELSIAKRYYERAIALTRGYQFEVKNYAYYNLGTAYLSCDSWEEAEYYLSHVEVLDEEPYHNLMLQQKRAVLYAKMGQTEKSREYIERAEKALKQIPEQSREYELCEQMFLFAKLLTRPDYMNIETYEEILKKLYHQTEPLFGFGFRRFYGEFLIQLYKHQRKYKEALLIKEKINISYD